MRQVTIDALAEIDLRSLDGDASSIAAIAKSPAYAGLMEHAVRVSVLSDVSKTDDDLRAIVAQLPGDYKRFVELREKTQKLLLERADVTGATGWMALTVLFSGVYVGDASDILRVRRGVPPMDFGVMEENGISRDGEHTHIMRVHRQYKVPSGIGTKVAEVQFV